MKQNVELKSLYCDTMYKISTFLFIILIISSASLKAQQYVHQAISSKDTASIADDFLAIDSSEKDRSHVVTAVGLGNEVFSEHNKSINTKQTASELTLVPSIGYFHKSGLSLSLAAYLPLGGSSKSSGISQYSITPQYDLPDNDNIDFSASYTHYFIKDKSSPNSSPIQNDIYSSFTYKKKWLQPGIAFGYSRGEDLQYYHKDTIVSRRKKVLYYDSVSNNISAVTFIAMVGHNFEWTDLLKKEDAFSFTPSVMFNIGSGKNTLNYNRYNSLAFEKSLIKRGKIDRLQNTPFEAESVGINFDINYSIGRFRLSPQLYIDYYLPSTTETRFSQIFFVNIGVQF